MLLLPSWMGLCEAAAGAVPGLLAAGQGRAGVCGWGPCLAVPWLLGAAPMELQVLAGYCASVSDPWGMSERQLNNKTRCAQHLA